MYAIALNGIQLCDPYEDPDEAEAFAAGYAAALSNNEIVTEGAFELITFELAPNHPDGAIEVNREPVF